MFDLDGTLCDTLEDIAGAVNAVLCRMNFPQHPQEAYKRFVGEGIGVLAARALPSDHQDEAAVKAFARAIGAEYGGRLLEKTAPYHGIVHLLKELVKRKIKLAVASNKPHDLTLRTVFSCFPSIPFGAVLGERKGVPPKPDPAIALDASVALGVAPGECLYAGDSGIDMKTAVAAGMYPVGVLWGFRDADELLSNGAKALIKHPLELLDLLDRKYFQTIT